MNVRPVATGASPTSADLPPGARRSHALESLSQYLAADRGLRIMDFGGLNQSNLDFLSSFGHSVYGENLLLAVDHFFSPRELETREIEDSRIHAFLDDTINFKGHRCQGALVWDTLQFIPPKLAASILERLRQSLTPGAPIMAFFHPENAPPGTQPHTCRIFDHRHLILSPRVGHRPITPFNTRSIERFFQQFQSVKFFLTRENLQEVIARR